MYMEIESISNQLFRGTSYDRGWSPISINRFDLDLNKWLWVSLLRCQIITKWWFHFYCRWSECISVKCIVNANRKCVTIGSTTGCWIQKQNENKWLPIDGTRIQNIILRFQHIRCAGISIGLRLNNRLPGVSVYKFRFAIRLFICELKIEKKNVFCHVFASVPSKTGNVSDACEPRVFLLRQPCVRLHFEHSPMLHLQHRYCTRQLGGSRWNLNLFNCNSPSLYRTQSAAVTCASLLLRFSRFEWARLLFAFGDSAMWIRILHSRRVVRSCAIEISFHCMQFDCIKCAAIHYHF